MRLKVCGMTGAEDIAACSEHADALGFIVEFPESPRSVTIEEARELMRTVPPFITRVAVIPDFTNAERIYNDLHPDAVQLHGSETAEDVRTFKEGVRCPVIKACGAADALEFARHADAVLIDNKYGEYSPDEVQNVIAQSPVPVILAGGLAPDNILDVLGEVRPYGLDVASGVETRPGRKDPAKVRLFRKRMDLGMTVGGIVGRKGRDIGLGKGREIGQGNGHDRMGQGNEHDRIFRFYKSVSKQGLSVITEIKPSSPSGGELREPDDLNSIVGSMERGGADAISILVEPEQFGGSLELLAGARSSTELPLLAKGFLLNDNDINKAARAGADAVLLMKRVLDAELQDLSALIQHCNGLNIDAVVEVATADELASSIKAGARIIQVNNRDIYGDLDIDLRRTGLGRGLPRGVIFISASGVEGPSDIAKIMVNSGGRADAVLIGTSIMRSEDVEAKVRELATAAKEAAG